MVLKTRKKPAVPVVSILEQSKLKHNAEKWLRDFNDAGNGTKNPDMGQIRYLRQFILEQTLNTCLDEKNVNLPNNSLEKASKRTQVFRANVESIKLGERAHMKSDDERMLCKVEVKDSDCIDEAMRLMNLYNGKVAVLNMANARIPGGGYKHGAGAQEENLHRRSNLFMYLEDRSAHVGSEKCYPIPNDALLYSENVSFFRGSEADGYPYIDSPLEVDVISCAAMNHPKLVVDPDTKLLLLDENEANALKAKIHNIYAAAEHNGAKCLVLSALGCGAFKNPPLHVAQLFKEVLERSYKDSFEHIVFAIFDDHNAYREHNPEGNLIPFRKFNVDKGISTACNLYRIPAYVTYKIKVRSLCEELLL